MLVMMMVMILSIQVSGSSKDGLPAIMEENKVDTV